MFSSTSGRLGRDRPKMEKIVRTDLYVGDGQHKN